MGVAVVELETKKCVRLMRAQIREKNTGGDDIGSQRLLILLNRWILREAKLFSQSVVVIENQPPDAQREVVAIQHGIQMRLGGRCKAVQAGAYKAIFGDDFPRHPNYFEFKNDKLRKDAQKRYDRRSAVVNGKGRVDPSIVAAYEEENKGEKFDDAYEALYIALYGIKALVSKDGTHLLPTPRAAPRRKVADGPHPRGRVAVTKAEAKRAARATLPKAKPKATAKKATASTTNAAAAAAAAAAAVVTSADKDDDDALINFTSHKRKRGPDDDTTGAAQMKASRTD